MRLDEIILELRDKIAEHDARIVALEQMLAEREKAEMVKPDKTKAAKA